MAYHRLERTLILPWLLSQKSKHTTRAYERILGNFFEENKNVFLEQVSPIQIAQFLSKVQSSGGQSKFNQARSALASFFDFHIRTGVISINPVLSFKTKSVPLPITKFLPDELIYVRAVNEEPIKRNRLMLHFAFVLGLRIQEILDLHISSLLQGINDDVYLFIKGKGGRNREVLIPKWLQVLIEEYLKEAGLISDCMLFHSPKDKRKAITQSQAYRIFISAGRRIGFKRNLNPHRYRHGHAVTALQKGASLKALKDSMGHSSLMALQRYVDQAKLQQPSNLFDPSSLLEFKEPTEKEALLSLSAP